MQCEEFAKSTVCRYSYIRANVDEEEGNDRRHIPRKKFGVGVMSQRAYL